MKNLRYSIYKKILLSLCMVLFILGSNNYVSIATDNIEYNKWEVVSSEMSIKRGFSTAGVINNKIYVVGGKAGSPSHYSLLEEYDPKTDLWTIKSPMPTPRTNLTSAVYDNKLYVFGGMQANSSQMVNKTEVYNPETDTWETKAPIPYPVWGAGSATISDKIYVVGGVYYEEDIYALQVYDTKSNSWSIIEEPTEDIQPSHNQIIAIDSTLYIFSYHGSIDSFNTKTNEWNYIGEMPTARQQMSILNISNKIYCIGGRELYNGNINSNLVEIYNAYTQEWEKGNPLPLARNGVPSVEVEGKIYVIGGNSPQGYLKSVVMYRAPLITDEQIALDATVMAENSRNTYDIDIARDKVNKLTETKFREDLQSRISLISPIMEIDLKESTSNLDVYIKSENILSVSIDTNNITFEDFSGVTDMEKINALNLTVSSSLPYQLNAYLPTEIQSTNKSTAMDKTILNIKENSELTYQTFVNTVDKIVLKDNCIAGNDINHGVDLKLKGSIAHEKNIYKTTIKFEIEQK